MDPRLDEVLDVAAGRKQLMVGVEPTTLLKLGLAVFAAMLLATIIAKRL